MSSEIYIRNLPKDKLLFYLWQNARLSQNFYYCKEKAHTITQDTCYRDINIMLANGRKLDITTYQGRLIFADISGDFLDPFNYDVYNGRGKAKAIITRIKKEELDNMVLTYYKSL